MEYSTQLSSETISIEGNGMSLQWPAGTGWNITPDREPCEVCVLLCYFSLHLHPQLSKEVLSSHEMIPYPPMIRLEIERVPTSSSQSSSIIPVEIMGIRERGKRFKLKPKPQQNSRLP